MMNAINQRSLSCKVVEYAIDRLDEARKINTLELTQIDDLSQPTCCWLSLFLAQVACIYTIKSPSMIVVVGLVLVQIAQKVSID